MSSNGAREVIFGYLSTFRMGVGQKALRRDIEIWCYSNQQRNLEKGVKSDTYQQQIRKMIIDSGKWKDGWQKDGLNDVFCPCSAGKPYAKVYDPKCCTIKQYSGEIKS
jgi:hypothetical protein